MTPDHPQHEAALLAEVFGAPAQDHSPQAPTATAFTEDQRARWVTLASLAANEAGLAADPGFRAALTSYLDWSSRVAMAQAGRGPAVRWDWGPAGPPATTPAPASTTADEPPVALPAPGETVSFEAHIKPLFRARDRQSMTFAFDLWSYPDVQAHAAGILERLVNGTMPCDGAWPPEQTAVFRRWTESGTQP